MKKCLTLHGDWVEVPEEKLVFRPAAYAVIVRDGKMLLLRTKTTGKYWFPGGGIEVSESLPDGLDREVREETGLSSHYGIIAL